MRYSLYNPFMSWQFDRRAFGDPEPSGGGGGSDPSPSPSPAPAARSESEVQADINAALSASGGDWTP